MQVDVTTYRAADTPVTSAVQRALLLKTFPGFVALDASELAVLASVTRERFFPKGTVIHQPGVPVMAFHLVIEGRVEVYKKGVVVDVLDGRSSVGGIAALTRDPAGAHIVALEDVFALEIDTDDMQDVFEDNYNILLGVLAAMARGLRQAQIAKGGGAAMDSNMVLVGVEGDEPLTLVEKMFFLRKTSNFGQASIEALADLAEGTSERRYEHGATIWAHDAEAQHSIMILKGSVLCEPPDVKSWEFGPGWIVGGLDAMCRERHWYKASAVGEVRLLVMPRTLIFDVLEDHIEMAMELLRNFAKGLSALLEMMAKMAKQQKADADAA